jgi:hypothetical protein
MLEKTPFFHSFIFFAKLACFFQSMKLLVKKNDENKENAKIIC